METFTQDPRFQTNQKKKSGGRTTNWAVILAAILAIATIVNIVLFYINFTNSQIPPKSNEDLALEVIDSFNKIYNVPQGEEPAIIVITDIDKLREQDATFYKDAKNGDHIIIIGSTKLAIIYRKTDQKIINAANIAIDENTQGTTQEENSNTNNSGN